MFSYGQSCAYDDDEEPYPMACNDLHSLACSEL